MYDSVPNCVYNFPFPSLPLNNILNPKSAIFKLKLLSNNIFSGFRSRCAKPALCIASKPFIICKNNVLVKFVENIPVYDIISNNSPFGQYSNTNYIIFYRSPFFLYYIESYCALIKLTIFICFTWLNILTSLSNNLINFSSILFSDVYFNIFIAYFKLVIVSIANLTLECCPVPNVFSILY